MAEWLKRKDSFRFTHHLLRSCKTFYLLSVEALVEDDSKAPNVYLRADLRRVFADDEAFWWEIPVGSCSLRGEVHPVLRVVVLRIHDLGQPEIGDLHVAAHATVGQQNVALRGRHCAMIITLCSDFGSSLTHLV